jgi:anti-sigma regulatory factor (Ser/Thr protein kinase)
MTAVSSIAGHQVLAVRVLARPDNVGHVRRLLAAFAAVHGAKEATIRDIALSASEAVTNAVVHGSARDPSRCVDVVADYEDHAMEVVIADDGPGVSAGVPSDGLGLGLGLIARSASRFAVRERDPRGTEVWMRFELG